MIIEPIYDNVLIELPAVEKEEKTSSGIYLPGTTPKERPQTGVIVAVGDGKLNESGNLIALQVKVGDKVLYQKYAGTQIQENGKEYLLLKEREILAILK